MLRVYRQKRMRETMKIAICDDLPQFNRLLKEKIESICAKNDWSLDAMIFSSPQAILATDLSTVQVVFLDIDMPGINGLEVAKAIRVKYPSIVLVFVTAYIEYAPAGYRVEAFRYLLKQKLEDDLPLIMQEIQKKLHETSETIEIRNKEGTSTVAIDTVVYIEGTPSRMVLFHINSDKKPIEAFGKLIEYEKLLEQKGFLRVQKSFIVNMAEISKISNYQVTMRNGDVIKASEKNYKKTCSVYLQWKGKYL